MTDQIQDLQNRLTELESTVAFLDDTVEQLNAVITKQDNVLATQERLLQMLIERSSKGKSDSGIEPFNVHADVPPHY